MMVAGAGSVRNLGSASETVYFYTVIASQFLTQVTDGQMDGQTYSCLNQESCFMEKKWGLCSYLMTFLYDNNIISHIVQKNPQFQVNCQNCMTLDKRIRISMSSQTLTVLLQSQAVQPLSQPSFTITCTQSAVINLFSCNTDTLKFKKKKKIFAISNFFLTKCLDYLFFLLCYVLLMLL